MKTNCLLLAIIFTGLLTVATGGRAQDNVTHFTASDGTKVTLISGQPAPDHYGPAPNFGQLDTNHDGYISRDEAEAYLPLFNDFDFPAQHANRISKQQYEFWKRRAESIAWNSRRTRALSTLQCELTRGDSMLPHDSGINCCWTIESITNCRPNKWHGEKIPTAMQITS